MKDVEHFTPRDDKSDHVVMKLKYCLLQEKRKKERGSIAT